MAKPPLNIALIGDHNPTLHSHIATEEALHHAAASLDTPINIIWLPTNTLLNETAPLKLCAALWAVPGLHANREGILNAIRFARENNTPFLGTCGGFQNTLIEYAQNVLNIKDADHEETAPESPTLFITKLACSLIGSTQKVNIKPDTRAHRAYGKTKTAEQFNCNYGLNPIFRGQIENSPLKISGTDQNNEPRIIELPTHKFFIATLFQPQLSSKPEQPHPLITAYLKTALPEC